MEKKCSKCKVVKLFSEFYKDRSQKSGLACWCHSCRKTLRNNWAKTHRDRHLKRLIEYSQTPKGRYVSIKTGAKRRGKDFLLSYEEYLENFFGKPCYYCGGPTENGVDRVSNELGYSPENCVSSCGLCNKMKLTNTQGEFIERCRKIVNHLYLTGELSKRKALAEEA